MAFGSTLRIAWRNLGRNTRRTALALSAIGVAELVLVVYQGLIVGYVDQMVQSVTGPVVGHLQVHAPKWREDRALDRSMPNASALVTAIERVPGVVKVSTRLYGPTLAAKGQDGQAAMVVGVDPAVERHLGVLEGVRLERLPRKGEVLVGTYLAQKLDAKAGDELALVGQAVDGSIAANLYRIYAVVSTDVDPINRMGIVMRLDDARELLAMPEAAHELVVVGADPQAAAELARQVAALPELAGLEVLPWQKLMPEIAAVLSFVWAYEYFLLLLVFVAAAAGAANTMMMATFERTRELGMLLALGLKPRRVVSMVVTEGVLLGLIGLAFGAALGVGVVLLTSYTGLDLSRVGGGDTDSIAFMGMKWSMVVHPQLSLPGLGRSLVAVLVTSVLAAVWPAMRAARLQPVEAMRA